MHHCPKISVLIRTTWRDSLAQTLRSVAQQTYSNIEIVLVAPQKGRWTHPDLVGESLQLILTEQLMPRARAANLALDSATGEYCIFLDDDDWWQEEHLSGLINAMLEQDTQPVQGKLKGDVPFLAQTTTSSNCWAVHSLTELRRQPGSTSNENLLEDSPNVIGHAFEPLQLLTGNCLPIHSVLFPRYLVTKYGCRFDEQMDLYEDWDFWLQVAQTAQFKCVPRVTAFYWMHQSSGVHDLEAFENAPAQFVYLKWFPLVSQAMRAALMKNATLYPPTRAQLLVSENKVLSTQETLSASIQDKARVDQALQEERRQRDALEQVNLGLLEQLAALEVQRTKLDHLLKSILLSKSWKLTQPLRQFFGFCNRQKHAVLDSTVFGLLVNWVWRFYPFFLERYLHSYLSLKSRLNQAFNPAGYAQPHVKAALLVQRPLGVDPREKKMALLCVYAPTGLMGPSTVVYLNALTLSGYAVVVCAAVEDELRLDEAHLDNAQAIVVRKNAGYDFAAWAATLTALPQLWNAQAMLFTNDSVWGPIKSFPAVMERIEHSSADFVALTDSYQIKYHTQSYFFVLKGRALTHPSVQVFWSTMLAYQRKDHVILHGELALYELIDSLDDVTVEVLFPATQLFAKNDPLELFRVNPTHHAWRILIEQGFPFMKAELLLKNPYQLDISAWSDLIKAQGLSDSTFASILAQMAFVNHHQRLK